MSRTKILVVDDFVPWHHFVLQVLEPEADLNVICFAADGLEAVQRAQELQPDVVLMDFNLAVLDGLEAARRIRVLCPLSEILFVSEHRSLEVIEAAFSLGASGYILKTDSYSDLILGVRARRSSPALCQSYLAGLAEGFRRRGLGIWQVHFSGAKPLSRLQHSD